MKLYDFDVVSLSDNECTEEVKQYFIQILV